MKRIQYHRYGGPEVMVLEDYSLPEPEGKEIIVAVKAASINPVDWKLRRGKYKFLSGRYFPKGMGADFAGVVEQTGPEAGFEVGERIFGAMPLSRSGSFAEQVLTPSKYAAKLPDGVSFEQAACLPLAASTAWITLYVHGKLKAGSRVLVNGCTGGVGQAAVQIAQAAGASVAGSCGTSSLGVAHKMGVDPVFDYSVDDVKGGTYDIVLDTSGAMRPGQGFSLLSDTGVFVDLNPAIVKFVRAYFTKRLKLTIWHPHVKIFEIVGELAAERKLTFSIDRKVPLEDAIALITELEKGHHGLGKAVIVM